MSVEAEGRHRPSIDGMLEEKGLVADTKNLSISEEHSTTAPSSRVSAEDTKPAYKAPPAGPISTPFPHPLPQYSTPQPTATLTPDQEKKYNDLLSTVSAWTEIPTTSSRWSKKEPITEDERMWLTRECLLRYLRATKWTNSQAATRLLATLTWRREYGLAKFTSDYISPENETGKQVILGFDNDARPCLYLNPSKQNTAKSDRQLHHLVYMLERVIDLMGPGQETTALLINFNDSGSSSSVSVAQGRATLVILQGHYPERLGRALISELPWYITTFFKFISPFIDPVTKSKMKFNEPLIDHVPAEQLWKHYGGKADFEYDHKTYWPALDVLCQQRRTEYRTRWEKAGKKIGEHEEYLRGGAKKCSSGQYTGSDMPEGFTGGGVTTDKVPPV